MNDFSNAFAQHVTITDEALVLDLADGRTISAPLSLVSPFILRHGGRAKSLAIDWAWGRD